MSHKYLFLPVEGYMSSILKKKLQLLNENHKIPFAYPFTSSTNFLIKLSSILLAPLLLILYAPLFLLVSLFSGILALACIIHGNTEDAGIDIQMAMINLTVGLACLIAAPFAPLVNLLDFIGSGIHNLVLLNQSKVTAKITMEKYSLTKESIDAVNNTLGLECIATQQTPLNNYPVTLFTAKFLPKTTKQEIHAEISAILDDLFIDINWIKINEEIIANIPEDQPKPKKEAPLVQDTTPPHQIPGINFFPMVQQAQPVAPTTLNNP